MWWRVVLLFIAARFVGVVPEAAFHANEGTPRTGDPIMLTLTVRTAADASVMFPAFPGEWAPFEVLSIDPASNYLDGDVMVWQQVISVVLWRPGDAQTPETVVGVRSPDGSIETVAVQPAFFSVPSVINENDLNLRPLKPPQRIPAFPYAILLFVAAALGLGSALWWRRRLVWLPAKSEFAERKWHPAAEVALRELRLIASQKLSSEERIAQTADCLRRYVRTRFGVPAPERTTREATQALSPVRQLSDEQQQRFRQFLNLADRAKFSGSEMAGGQVDPYVQQAQLWVREVEKASLPEDGE